MRRTSTLTTFFLLVDWYMHCSGLPRGQEYLSNLTAERLLGRIIGRQTSLQDVTVMLTNKDGHVHEAHAQRKATSDGMQWELRHDFY